MERIGYYCWAGPGTIRMINLKFFNPSIDKKSLMSSYEYDYISEVKDKFGITDFWATYSWGFSDSIEIEDKKFLLDRIQNFKRAGVKLHAYVQGPNMVQKDFSNVDWYCKDNAARPIVYYRGRRVVCVNNPGFVEYKLGIINEMLDHEFDGIFMDNIQMGQLGIPFHNIRPMFFAGCTCKYCQALFQDKYGDKIPQDFSRDFELIDKYLNFRTESMTGFLKTVSKKIKEKSPQVEFGTNSFDPKLELKYTNGIDLDAFDKIQDYFLFENHSLPNRTKNNHYVAEATRSLKHPSFVISYKKGVGYDSRYSQWDMNRIATEDKNEPFYSCIKGSEYVTNNTWHNLDINNYSAPKIYKYQIHLGETSDNKKFEIFAKNWIMRQLVILLYNPLYTMYMENHLARKILHKIFYSFVL